MAEKALIPGQILAFIPDLKYLWAELKMLGSPPVRRETFSP
jgi:hypothetical protein